MTVDQAKAQLISDRLAAGWPNIDMGIAQMFDTDYATNGNDADAAYAVANAQQLVIGPAMLKRAGL